MDQRVNSFAEVELGYSATDLAEEATRCLECGCTALFDCDLRKLRDRVRRRRDALPRRGAGSTSVDIAHPLIELDANKCILCGRCVRICSDVVGVSAYGFINRGFGTVVAPALGGSLLDTECVSCGLCIGTCPTGAIAQHLPLAKPGPWKTEPAESVCHYCGVGCRINYDRFGDTLVKVSRNEANEVTFGNHCRKGRFGFNFVHAQDRLLTGRVRVGDALADAPVDEAIAHAAARLKELARKHSGREIAVFVSPRLTNEEIYLAQKFARVALRTHNVTSFSHLVNRELFAPDVVATATYPDLAQAQAILVVSAGLDEEHFVVDLIAKRAIRNGARMVFIGPKENRSARFAELFLECRPEAETTVVQAIVAEARRAGGPGAGAGAGRRDRRPDAGADRREDGDRSGRDRRSVRHPRGRPAEGDAVQPRLPRSPARGRRPLARGGRRGARLRRAAAPREVERAGAARHGREPRVVPGLLRRQRPGDDR
ncbi:MAG: molybdopterin-dependent oxidoreductase [Ignavibacteriales bacterium]|nr:molybdopterin-dependent oxidoreductase [Ignavibacteriales bacterium]